MKPPSLIIAFVIAAVILVVPLGFYIFQFGDVLSTKQADWGFFGDYFGGAVGPFLSFAVLVVLIGTYHLQRKEVKQFNKDAQVERQLRFAEKVYGEFDEALDLKMKLGLPEALPPTYGSQEVLVQSVIDLGGLTEERGRILFGESSPPFRGKVAPKWMAERAGTSPGWTPLAFEIFGGNLGRVTKLVRELNEVVRNIELTTRATDVNEFYSSRCSPYAQNLVLAGYVSPTDISAIWKGNHIRVEDNKELRVYKRVNGELIKVKTAAKDSVEYFKILSSPRS